MFTFISVKKLIVAIVVFLYITTSVDATVNMHYCMGKLADWNIGYKQSKSCGLCGMEKSTKKSNGCCKGEIEFVKNNTDQK